MSCEYRIVPIGDIYPDPDQPRKTGFDEADLVEMAESVKTIGIFQNLRASPDGKGKFKLVCGERRYRSALMAGLMEVPVIIDDDLSDFQRLEIQLAENMLRRDLSIRERAEAIARFTELHPDRQAAAKRLGISNGHLTHLIELTNLAPEVAALSESNVTRDATTLVLANQLIKKAPEAAKVILAQAKQDGKLPRKTIMEALKPHRRPRKKNAGVEEVPPTPPSPQLPTQPVAANEVEESQVVVRSPSRSKIKRVCALLKIDEQTDPAVVLDQLVDLYLAGNGLRTAA